MYHVIALLPLVAGWILSCTPQMAPYGFPNSLFGGFSPYPPPSQLMSIPFGLDSLTGPAQVQAPIIYQPSPYGGLNMPLPFPLFPMPCDMGCEHAGLFFANISILNQPSMPAGPGTGAGGSASGMLTTVRPSGGSLGAGMSSVGGGMMPGAGGSTMPGAGGGILPGVGVTSVRPGVIPGQVTTSRSGGGMTMMPATMPTIRPATTNQQNPNVNAQFLYVAPQWCTGWCRFFYRPRPILPPSMPPPMPIFQNPACLLFSWLGFM